MNTALRPALVLLGLFTALTGIAYPLAVTGLAQLAFPRPPTDRPLRSAAAWSARRLSANPSPRSVISMAALGDHGGGPAGPGEEHRQPL